MIVATSVIAGLGLVSGLGLALAARIFAVETDPRQEEIADLLPGANCGGCGYAGCGDFAGALVQGKVEVDGCPVCDAASKAAMAAVMGVSFEEKERRVAMVHCQGTDDVAARKFHYNGLASCASADLIGGGDKTCAHGCLGLGDCQVVCSFGAIEITAGGVARIIPERCTSCGKCVEACPKGIIDIVPAAAAIHILCANTDKGGTARRACSLACIGCKKCEKHVADGSIFVENFLAKIDYDRAPIDDSVIEICPTGAIRNTRVH